MIAAGNIDSGTRTVGTVTGFRKRSPWRPGKPNPSKVALFHGRGGVTWAHRQGKTNMIGTTVRQRAIAELSSAKLLPKVNGKNGKDLHASFGENVFNLAKMKPLLPGAVFKSLKKTIEAGATLDSTTADAVASAMKEWAI